MCGEHERESIIHTRGRDLLGKSNLQVSTQRREMAPKMLPDVEKMHRTVLRRRFLSSPESKAENAPVLTGSLVIAKAA